MTRKNLIIGGTGTLGKALLDFLDPETCIVFSRDELKQHELKHKYKGLKCILGDIRNKRSLEKAFDTTIESVFHVAALKHVDVLEENVEEAYQTNVVGTINSAELAKEYKVRNFYFTSTDKAVLPINVYGMTKAISERYLLNQNEFKPFSTSFRVFRWGNILGSRGSVVSLFVNSLKRKKQVRITDENMTRFWLRIDDAIEFMLSTKEKADRVIFPQMKAAKVTILAKAIADIMGIREFETEIIGLRPGEKLHECMYSSHDQCLRSDTADQFQYDELVSLLRPIVEDML